VNQLELKKQLNDKLQSLLDSVIPTEEQERDLDSLKNYKKNLLKDMRSISHGSKESTKWKNIVDNAQTLSRKCREDCKKANVAKQIELFTELTEKFQTTLDGAKNKWIDPATHVWRSC